MAHGDEGNGALRIGDVARRLGVSPSTVRSWERRGLVTPQRSDGGTHRRYDESDLSRLREIHSLLSQGFTPPALRALLEGDGPPEAARVGSRLRQARTKRGLSIRHAAGIAGVSPSYLSQVERGLADPSASLLQRVTRAYGGSLLEVFGSGPASAEVKLVRSGERVRLSGFDGVEMEDLVQFPNALIDIDIFTIAAGGGSGGDYSHDGEEAILVLDGGVSIWLDGREHYELATGDTLYFRSTQRHRWTNPGPGPARVLWVNTPPAP